MTCGNCRSAIATRRYAYGQGAMRNIAALCDSCVVALSAIGMDLRPQSAPVADTRPEWLRRLQPKVMDHGGSAA